MALNLLVLCKIWRSSYISQKKTKKINSTSWSTEHVSPYEERESMWLTEPLVVWATNNAISSSPEKNKIKIAWSPIPFVALTHLRQPLPALLTVQLSPFLYLSKLTVTRGELLIKQPTHVHSGQRKGTYPFHPSVYSTEEISHQPHWARTSLQMYITRVSHWKEEKKIHIYIVMLH